MYKTPDYDYQQICFVNFNATCGMQLDRDNGWIKNSHRLPWQTWEVICRDLYLTGSEENESGLKWNVKMHALYREMLHYKNSLCGTDSDPNIVADFEKRYDEILELAKEEYENDPPSEYYREGYNLYKRLLQYKESHLLFLHNKGVPADNSLAERLARIYKRKQKQAIVLRSEDNFVNLCEGLSVIYTYRQKDDVDLFELLKEIFSRAKPKPTS